MTQAILIFLGLSALFLLGAAGLGHEALYKVAYGALTLMAAMISLTFLWLWSRRATPLALGMSLSWAGAGLVLGWWWVFRLLGGPRTMVENEVLFLFLALYFAGAILHFSVIRESLGAKAILTPIPPVLALAVSAAIVRLF